MKKALLLGIAALLMLGCSAADYKNKSFKTVKPVVIKGSSVQLAEAPATGVDQGRTAYVAMKKNRPTEHQMAVHRFHEDRAKSYNITNQWQIKAPELSARQKEALQKVKEKQQEALMGQMDEPGMNRIWTNKKKREAKERMQGMRQAVMNSLDEPHAYYRNRLDIDASDINHARMPGNGLVGNPEGGNDHFIRASECRHGSCISTERSPASRMQRLGNTLD